MEKKTMDKRVNLIMTSEEFDRLAVLANENAARNKSYLIRKLIEMAWEEPTKFNLRRPKRSRGAA